MKIFLIILAVIAVGLATTALVNYLLQRRSQNRAQSDGVVIYAVVLSAGALGGWAKHLDMKKIVLRLQEPGEAFAREVTLRTRLAPNQKVVPGLRFAVAIDPQNPKRIYPASPEAAKRLVLTGSRQERRQLKAQASGSFSRTRGVERTPNRMPGIREKR